MASSDTNQQLKQQHQQQTSDQLQQQQDQQLNADANSNNFNKIPESDILIPTSNLQKFIESADKILKNITVIQQQQPSSVAPADNVNKCKYIKTHTYVSKDSIYVCMHEYDMH